MKPIYASFFFLFLILMTTSQTAQAQAFQKGTNVVSLGIGLGSSLLSYSGSSQTPAISANFERGIWDIGGPGVVSLGGYIGYKGYSYDGSYSSGYKWSEKWNYTIVGIRSAYHYNGLSEKKIDLYGGVMLSANIVSYKYTNSSGYNESASAGNYNSGAGFTAFVGGRYFFTDKIAAMAELGYGVSYLTIGASLKF